MHGGIGLVHDVNDWAMPPKSVTESVRSSLHQPTVQKPTQWLSGVATRPATEKTVVG